MPDSSVPRTFNEGGVSTPGWFNVGVLFQNALRPPSPASTNSETTSM
jgi:hypothetical protein